MANIEDLKKAVDDAEKVKAKAVAAYEKQMGEEASGQISGALNLLEEYKAFLSPEHRRTIQVIAGIGAAKATRKQSKTPNEPKFDIKGKTWSGLGRPPIEYVNFDNSEKGNAWRKENPNQRYPYIKGYVPTDADKAWTPKVKA